MGQEGVPLEVRPLPNTHPHPDVFFRISPEDLLRELRRAEELSKELWGFYHSHPQGPPHPSPHDSLPSWPGAFHVLVFLQPQEGWSIWKQVGDRLVAEGEVMWGADSWRMR